MNSSSYAAYIISENIVSPLGFTAEENFKNVSENRTGVKTIRDPEFIPVRFSGARLEDTLLEKEFQKLNVSAKYTRLEKMMLLSITDALKRTGIDAQSKETVFIFSTTKGNIELLNSKFKNEFEASRIQLWKTAQVIAEYFGNKNKPVVICGSVSCSNG